MGCQACVTAFQKSFALRPTAAKPVLLPDWPPKFTLSSRVMAGDSGGTAQEGTI
ncbi:MAG: hypothetical protein BWX84_02560 [Verrucomicrobia bacterium ADurb.Bin118]|nr:MAG: hypothetical protein BWX84_02560 [Verrucomicrobia bacterium ADurb.Bin118]